MLKQYSMTVASAVVFTYSSLLHEVIVLHIFGERSSQFYIFSMMMTQVMLIRISPMLRVSDLSNDRTRTQGTCSSGFRNWGASASSSTSTSRTCSTSTSSDSAFLTD